MFICNFPHFDRQFEFPEVHVFDIDQILKNIFVIRLGGTDPCLNGDIELLKLIFCAHQILHLAQIFNLIDDD
jgi:hypothetical protein